MISRKAMEWEPVSGRILTPGAQSKSQNVTKVAMLQQKAKGGFYRLYSQSPDKALPSIYSRVTA